MEFPFKFNVTNTEAVDAKVVIKFINEADEEHIKVTYDLEKFDQVVKNLRHAYRSAKRQARTQKKLERFAKKHTEIDQD
ncbi:hypothetical protein HUN41_00254 [Streptomyces phage Coruscant]|uniref:Uncharacterized protein n=1 Tax=Streptomyces phage Coruscant TaxID=2739834 RepID=A0A7G4AWF2_9CAUD|nr:hypothetical protein PP454_gp075 [Streptomyces phage Coruscant]QMP84342.1 hypothetical protein HUN41_00254 [Streptomyces phage Coruscant]